MKAYQRVYTKLEGITKATVSLRAQGVSNDELAVVAGRLAQVVRTKGDLVTLQIFSGTEGIPTDAEVTFLGTPPTLKVSEQLSGRFFEDLKHDVVEDLSLYHRNLLYVQGSKDTMVKPEVGGIALQSMHPDCRLNYVYIDNADHGFGLWDNQPDQSERLVDVTSKFLGKNL